MTDLPPKTRFQKLMDLMGWLRFQKHFEGWYPLLYGFIVFLLLCRFQVSDTVFKDMVEKVLPTAISVASILAGFQGAGQAVLLGILDSGTIAFLKRVGKFRALVSYLWSAIFTLLIASTISLGVLLTSATGRPGWMSPSWTMALLAGLFVYAGAASYRINRLMFRVLLLEVEGVGRPPLCLVDSKTSEQ